MKKFYYMSYSVFSYGKWDYASSCIEGHPIEWMIQTNQVQVMGHARKYVLLSWQEISEEEYHRYAGKL